MIKKIANIVLFSVFTTIASLAQSAPHPLGFELGKAKLEDIAKKFKLSKVPNPCAEMSTKYLVSDLKAANVKGTGFAGLTFDRNNVLQSVMIFYDRNEDHCLFISKTYKLLTFGRVSDGSYALFADGDFQVMWMFPDSDHQEYAFSVHYTSKIGREMNNKCEQKLGVD